MEVYKVYFCLRDVLYSLNSLAIFDVDQIFVGYRLEIAIFVIEMWIKVAPKICRLYYLDSFEIFSSLGRLDLQLEPLEGVRVRQHVELSYVWAKLKVVGDLLLEHLSFGF